MSYRIVLSRRSPASSAVSVNFQAVAAEMSSAADLSSAIQTATFSSDSSTSFKTEFNGQLAASPYPAISSQVVTEVVQMSAPVVVHSPSTPSPETPSSEASGGGSVPMHWIAIAGGAVVLFAIGGWVTWWQCTREQNEPGPAIEDLNIVLDDLYEVPTVDISDAVDVHEISNAGIAQVALPSRGIVAMELDDDEFEMKIED